MISILSYLCLEFHTRCRRPSRRSLAPGTLSDRSSLLDCSLSAVRLAGTRWPDLNLCIQQQLGKSRRVELPRDIQNRPLKPPNKFMKTSMHCILFLFHNCFYVKFHIGHTSNWFRTGLPTKKKPHHQTTYKSNWTKPNNAEQKVKALGNYFCVFSILGCISFVVSAFIFAIYLIFNSLYVTCNHLGFDRCCDLFLSVLQSNFYQCQSDNSQSD